jgi:hypothetical protein
MLAHRAPEKMEKFMQLNPADVADLPWRKSSKSGPYSDNCVEVAPLADGSVAVRHSKHPDGLAIGYTRDEFRAFIEGARDGEFDDLI